MYKYKFHYLLRQLPYYDYRIAMVWIPKQLGIAQSTWTRWIYLKKDNPIELPEHHLAGIASFFDCEISDLKTNVKKWDLKRKFQEFKTELNEY